MSLADDQKLLTRLLTDGALRDEFVQDPEGTAEKAGFSRDSANRIAQIPHEQLVGSGRSLIRKRAGAIEKILSQTYKALGNEEFQRLFREHAEKHWPKGSKRHLADALAFGEFLESQTIEPWIIELARWETAVLALALSSRRIVARKLNHHPAELRGALNDGLAPRKRLTLLLGLRLSRWRGGRWLAISAPWTFGSNR